MVLMSTPAMNTQGVRTLSSRKHCIVSNAKFNSS
jgi:hypothetical protein